MGSVTIVLPVDLHTAQTVRCHGTSNISGTPSNFAIKRLSQDVVDGFMAIPDMKLYRAGKIDKVHNRGTMVRLMPPWCGRMDYYVGMSRNETNAVSKKHLGYAIARVEIYFPVVTDRDFSKQDFDTVFMERESQGGR